MNNERAYIIYMKGHQNQVDVDDGQGGIITHIIQSEMLTIAVWAETPEEAIILAEEMKFRTDDIEGGKQHDYQDQYSVVAIIPSLLDLGELE